MHIYEHKTDFTSLKYAKNLPVGKVSLTRNQIKPNFNNLTKHDDTVTFLTVALCLINKDDELNLN